MATIFTRIINGEIPCYKVYEDEKYFAFLDINPLKKGHTLVIPKVEDDYIFNLDDETYAGLCLVAKKIAKALKESTKCQRVGVTVMGMEVPHVHIHLVPMDKEKDMLFSNPKLELSADEMKSIAEDIAKRI
ncbi:MAG: HIT family protein [Paludibacteraceae bacterium]|nr:HIT family protein [Paludibacteraceae bacterium]